MTTKDTAHTKIRSLSDECHDQMVALAKTGASFGRLAKFVQEQGKMGNIDVRSVEQAIRRYADDNPGLFVTKDPALARAIDLKHGGEPPGYIVKLRDAVADHIDTVAEMGKLYELQYERVLEYRAKEQEGEEVGSSLRAEIKVALQILRDVSGLQMDLEIVKKVPAELDVRFAHLKQLDVSAQLAELLAGKPEIAKLLESPEAIKEMLRGELIED